MKNELKLLWENGSLNDLLDRSIFEIKERVDEGLYNCADIAIKDFNTEEDVYMTIRTLECLGNDYYEYLGFKFNVELINADPRVCADNKPFRFIHVSWKETNE